MARFPSIDETGAFEAPEVQNSIKELVTGSTDGITVDTSVGTRVFVGDTMIHGDTGWRALAVWDSTGTFSHGSLPSTLHPTAGTAGAVKIRRVNDRVQFKIYGATASGLVLYSLPVGFRVTSQAEYYALYAPSSGVVTTASIRTFGMYIGAVGEVFDPRYGGLVEFYVDTPWPTSQPGIPQ